MRRNLQTLGNNKGLLLTRDMLEHLGITDTIEVTLEDGRIVLTAPQDDNAASRRQSFHEAADDTLEQYDEALKRLSQ